MISRARVAIRCACLHEDEPLFENFTSTRQVTPGAASRVIAAAEKSKRDNVAAQLFLSRNIIFERFRLLPRVLATNLRLVVSALGE